jgi:HKD family nuclease
MDRFGLSGEFLLTPKLARDLMVADRFKMDLGVTAIVRSTSDNKAKKIFTILSDKYTHINQLVLFDIIKQIEDAGEMGECKCFRWEISNFFTKLYVEFPKKAEELSGLYGLSREMIPGIMITTSDTGDASFAVRGTWRAEGSNSLIVNSEVKRKHIGDIDIVKIIDDISKDIFAEYAKLPEALCELMAKDVTDPAWDLKTSAGIKANQTEIENTFKTVFKRIGVVKAIGKKTEKILRQAMMDEIDPSIRYTAYDICMLIMSLPERVVFMDKNKDIALLQKACGQAPFADYSVDATVVLTA